MTPRLTDFPPATTPPRNNCRAVRARTAARHRETAEWRAKCKDQCRATPPPAETGGIVLRDARHPARCRGTAPPPDLFPGRPKSALRGGPHSPAPAGCSAPGSRTLARDCDDRLVPAEVHHSPPRLLQFPPRAGKAQ